MLRNRSSRSLLISDHIYQTLLALYPAEHRRAYGPLMAQAFRDMCRDAVRQGGRSALLRLWMRTLLDTAWNAAVEHLDRKGQTPMMSTRRHSLALVSSTFPLLLWLTLMLLNPRYAGRMLMAGRPHAQPLGWIMATAIMLLMGMAYATQRWSATLSSRLHAPAWLANRATMPGTLLAYSLVLFVLPATLLVLLGPAFLLLIEGGILRL